MSSVMLGIMVRHPYPVRDRALRQILRRYQNDLPRELLPATRDVQGPSGGYVLSTRRPGAVSNPS
ncbi:hypothetical protein ACIF8T_39240 [Streptomyces sp. NPDC085946]|uniref:hypothetical protein n=1 Tax=Streptomyces sp. NPDC085946 TaxID=3365744 RepID=UPI0037D1BB1D